MRYHVGGVKDKMNHRPTADSDVEATDVDVRADDFDVEAADS